VKGYGCECTCSSGIDSRGDSFSLYKPVAELRGPVFQPSLTRDNFETDSAMGISVFTDDRSMCTFTTDEEVSELCVYIIT